MSDFDSEGRMIKRTAELFFLLSLFFCVSLAKAESIGPWHLDTEHHQIVSRPKAIYEAGDAGVYVTCRNKAATFSIRVRDPVLKAPKVKLQFGGSSDGMVVFVGKSGTVRTYSGFSRGKNPRDAVANAQDSKGIVAELLKGRSRLAWLVDTDPDGYDSLEVRTSQFETALHGIGCAP